MSMAALGIFLTNCRGKRERDSGVSLGCVQAGSTEAAVQVQALVDHALGGEALAGASVGEFGVSAAHGAVLVQQPNLVRQAGGVVGAEIERSVAPDFPIAWDVVGNDRTPGKRGFKSRHSERFVTRRGSVNRGSAIERAELRIGLRPANRHRSLLGGYFYIGADRNSRQGHGLFRADDAHR